MAIIWIKHLKIVILQVLRVASSRIKHGDRFMLVKTRNQQLVDSRCCGSFDDRFRNNDCLRFYMMYNVDFITYELHPGGRDLENSI